MCMRDRRYRWMLVATAGIVLGLWVLSVLTEPVPPKVVPVVQAAQEDIYNSISVKGTVRAARESQEFVYAPARVEACYVSLGDTVTAGQALLRVSYPQAVDEAGQAAEAFLEQSANAAPGQAEESGPIVRASMDGTVAQLPEVGDLLLPGVTAVRLGDFSRLTVEAKVPELYAADLAVGQRANITPVSQTGQTFSASLTEIAPYAVQTFSLTGGTQSAVVRCSLDISDADTGLMPGTTVDVKLFTDTVRDAVTVPYAAVRQEDTQPYVFVCQTDGTVRRQEIQTGYQLSQGMQVTSGLEAGDLVVADGTIELSDGEKVRWDAGG